MTKLYSTFSVFGLWSLVLALSTWGTVVQAYDTCYVCGSDGYRVVNKYAMVPIPKEFWFLGQEEAYCRDLERWGANGSFPANVCQRFSSQEFYDYCQCQLTRMPTTAPVPRGPTPEVPVPSPVSLPSSPVALPISPVALPISPVAVLSPPVPSPVKAPTTSSSSVCIIPMFCIDGCGILFRVLGVC